MSQTSERKLKDSLAHIEKHRQIMHARINRDVNAAIQAFHKDTGCIVKDLDVFTTQEMSQACPKLFVTCAVSMRVGLTEITVSR